MLKELWRNRICLLYTSLYQVRHLCADEGARAVRPDPCFVPSGLHHERSGRRDKFCAAVHQMCIRDSQTPLPVCSSFGTKPAAGPKTLRVDLTKNAWNKSVKPRYVQQGGKLFVARSRQALHIAVNGLQCLLFRHDPLQGLVLSLIHIYRR